MYFTIFGQIDFPLNKKTLIETIMLVYNTIYNASGPYSIANKIQNCSRFYFISFIFILFYYYFFFLLRFVVGQHLLNRENLMKKHRFIALFSNSS